MREFLVFPHYAASRLAKTSEKIFSHKYALKSCSSEARIFFAKNSPLGYLAFFHFLVSTHYFDASLYHFFSWNLLSNLFRQEFFVRSSLLWPHSQILVPFGFTHCFFLQLTGLSALFFVKSLATTGPKLGPYYCQFSVHFLVFRDLFSRRSTDIRSDVIYLGNLEHFARSFITFIPST